MNNFSKKAENARSDRKLTARCPDIVEVVRDLIGRRPKKVSPKAFAKTWSFTSIVAKNLKERSSALLIQNPKFTTTTWGFLRQVISHNQINGLHLF